MDDIIKDNSINYKKESLLGEGGFATCYLIKNLNNNNLYAAKIFKKKSNSSKFINPIKKEIEIHKKLNHSNIVNFINDFDDDKFIYIILEYCHNNSLAELIKKRKNLSEIEIKFYILKIIDVLVYLKNKKIVHRDIKPWNLFITKNMDIKLGDFGLATYIKYENHILKNICGTPNYIAPEIINKTGYSYECDLWSLGILIYYMAFGYAPFDDNIIDNIYEKIKKIDYTFPKEKNVSKELKSLIQNILILDPNKRLNLDEIKNHEFFKTTVTLQTLPDFTLHYPLDKGFEINNDIDNNNYIIDFIYTNINDENKIAYFLSNGSIGICSYERRHYLLHDNNIITIEKNCITSVYSFDEFPLLFITDNFKILKKYFKNENKNYMSDTYSFVDYVRTISTVDDMTIFYLSNKNIQIIFKDNVMIIISKSNNYFILLNENKKTIYPLNSIINIKDNIIKKKITNIIKLFNNDNK